MGSGTAIALWMLGGTAGVCALYSWFLNRIHHIYAPNWIWLTVVGGNAIIGGAFVLWLWLTGQPLTPFYQLLALNIAGGIPVIGWQIWQAAERPSNKG